MSSLRDEFLLDPEVIFLNHGSFGACPQPVFAVYQDWQRRLEAQPVRFLGRDILSYLASARTSLGAYLNCPADDLVYFPNPTTAINVVARSLNLQPGDEILTSDHEYGAMDRTWQFICQKAGALYLHVPVGLPAVTAEQFVEGFWSQVTDRTRIIYLSHIASSTALRLPVEDIVKRARDAGIYTIIDGAHAPGQIPLDLTVLGADIYVGACHKWMIAAKGSAFLYASPHIQPLLEPLVVSWGYKPDPGYGSGNPFLDAQEWQGTRDLSAFLSVPAAIEFMASHHWPDVTENCFALAQNTHARILELTGEQPVVPDPAMVAPHFFAAFLPPTLNAAEVKATLYDIHRIEVPVYQFAGWNIIRVSIQGYNTDADVNTLISALGDLI